MKFNFANFFCFFRFKVDLLAIVSHKLTVSYGVESEVSSPPFYCRGTKI